MSERGGRRGLLFIIVPEDGEESRTYRASYRLLRLLTGVAVTFVIVVTALAASWWHLASRAALVPQLELEVARLSAERERVAELARQVAIIERRYAQIRGLFGRPGGDEASEVWMPPATTARRATGAVRGAPGPSLPTSWPLTERGYVTQGLLAGTDQDHPGLDIAVPSDSYVRASGGGTVVDVGENRVYGRFVVLDHGDGYSTLYAHMSRNLVAPGQRVRQNEVIALSGSTGRSTAPHLHFEILRNGDAVDPLEMVQQPS